MRSTAKVGSRTKPHHGWYIVAASFVTNLVLTGSFWQGFQVFFLPILREFGWSRAAISGAVSLRQLETGLFAPFLGFAVDRVGARQIIVISGIIVGTGMMAISQTSSLLTFYIFFLFASIGGSGASHGVTWPVVIAHWFNKNRGLALGIGTSGPFLAGLFLPVTAKMIVMIGWRPTMFLVGAFLMLIIIPLGALIRNKPEAPSRNSSGNDENYGRSKIGHVKAPDEGGLSLLQALQGVNFWICSAVFGILQFGSSAFHLHQIPYFEHLGFSTSDAALTVTFVLLFSGIGRLGAGALTDLLPLRVVLIAVTLMNTGGWVFLTAFNTTRLLTTIPFTFLFGVSFGAGVSLRPALLSKLYGTRSLGSLSGILQIGALLSGIVGPVATGYIFDITNEYKISLYLFSIVTLLALPIILLIKENTPSTLFFNHREQV